MLGITTCAACVNVATVGSGASVVVVFPADCSDGASAGWSVPVVAQRTGWRTVELARVLRVQVEVS